jgi:hypothetical protein
VHPHAVVGIISCCVAWMPKFIRRTCTPIVGVACRTRIDDHFSEPAPFPAGCECDRRPLSIRSDSSGATGTRSPAAARARETARVRYGPRSHHTSTTDQILRFRGRKAFDRNWWNPSHAYRPGFDPRFSRLSEAGAKGPLIKKKVMPKDDPLKQIKKNRKQAHAKLSGGGNERRARHMANQGTLLSGR